MKIPIRDRIAFHLYGAADTVRRLARRIDTSEEFVIFHEPGCDCPECDGDCEPGVIRSLVDADGAADGLEFGIALDDIPQGAIVALDPETEEAWVHMRSWEV